MNGLSDKLKQFFQLNKKINISAEKWAIDMTKPFQKLKYK